MEISETHANQSEQNARKLGALESDVNGLKSDIGQIRSDVRQGFAEVFTKMDRVTAPRATPWGAVAVLLTTLTGLAAWANSWVSQGISNAAEKAERAASRAEQNAHRLDDTSDRLTQHQISEAEKRGQALERLRWIERGVIDNPPERLNGAP